MDFVHDQLATGTKLRVLTFVATFSSFSPTLEPRLSFRGADVVEVLERVGRGWWGCLKGVDQGTELCHATWDLWAYRRGVKAQLWFLSPADAREKMEDWRKYYNEERPHGAIGQITPIMLLNHVGAASPPS